MIESVEDLQYISVEHSAPEAVGSSGLVVKGACLSFPLTHKVQVLTWSWAGNFVGSPVTSSHTIDCIGGIEKAIT